MNRRYIILINRALSKVMVLDNDKVRYNRMRKRISDWVIALNQICDIKYVMSTLTYAPENNWEKNHIRSFMLSMRKVLGENLLAYAWVAELQRRGAIHYHVMFVVPNNLNIGDDLPYPDEAGLWPYGFTRLEIAKTPFYLITYLGKEYQKDFSRFPKSIRAFAVYIRDEKIKKSLRYLSLKDYQRSIVDESGWSELNSLTKIHKEIVDTENLSWKVGSIERGKAAAVRRAEGWEARGHVWKGRGMFVKEDKKQ